MIFGSNLPKNNYQATEDIICKGDIPNMILTVRYYLLAFITKELYKSPISMRINKEFLTHRCALVDCVFNMSALAAAVRSFLLNR